MNAFETAIRKRVRQLEEQYGLLKVEALEHALNIERLQAKVEDLESKNKRLPYQLEHTRGMLF